MKTFLKKLTSIKTLVSIWACALISYIVIADKANFLVIAQMLCAVPLAYIGANVWQKQIFSRSDNVTKKEQ